jgi:exopolysaccharide production protein ExoY
MRFMYNHLKRIFDILFSLCVLIGGAPLFLLLAFLIKCSSKGPVLYKSERIGRNFQPIGCWKFRTMHLHADQKLHSLFLHSPELKTEWNLYQKLKNDPRIHPIGRLLRLTSLDELPQFFNVLKGELSVVGPRPFLEDQVMQHLGAKASKFLSVQPGITGIWQVSGRNLLTFQDRLALEERYIDSQSFLLDLKIILKTFPALFSTRGAY